MYYANTERIYMTQHAKDHLTSLQELPERYGMTTKELASLMECSEAFIRHIARMRYSPSLTQYFKLASFLDWDLRHDVNRHYVHSPLSTREFTRRLRRLYPRSYTLEGIYFLLECETGCNNKSIKETIERTRPSCNTYGAIVHYIQKRESIEGFGDVLRFES